MGTGGVSWQQGCPASTRQASEKAGTWPPCPRLTYVFFLQVEDVVDGLLHVLREPRHGDAVGVRGPALGKANVHLEGAHTQKLRRL